jgi:hypothetical protein
MMETHQMDKKIYRFIARMRAGAAGTSSVPGRGASWFR